MYICGKGYDAQNIDGEIEDVKWMGDRILSIKLVIVKEILIIISTCISEEESEKSI